MFLLVPAHPGFPGQIPQSRKTGVCVCVIESHNFKLCQKIDKKFFRPILMKLGVMLEIDETFTTM